MCFLEKYMPSLKRLRTMSCFFKASAVRLITSGEKKEVVAQLQILTQRNAFEWHVVIVDPA